MTLKRAVSLVAAYPAIVVALLFAVNLSYTGAGFNLHRLSLAGLLLFLWLARSIVRLDLSQMHIAWGWLAAVVVAYIGWLFVAPFLSTYPYASSTTATTLAALPLMFVGWLLLPSAGKPDTWSLTWRLLLLSALALGVWGIVDFLVTHQRSHAAFLDANAYAASINLFLVPLVYIYLNSPAARRAENPYVVLGMIAVLTAGQSMSLSRGALLSFLAVFPALLWLNRSSPVFWSRLSRLLAVLVSVHLLVNITPLARGQGMDALVFTPDQYVESDSVRNRVQMLESTWKMIGDSNLIVGSGLGTFKTYYSGYREVGERSLGNFTHNDYLQALQEGGLIQFTFFLVLTVFTPVWILYKHRSRWARNRSSTDPDIGPGLLLGVLCVSAHALINFIHYVGPIALVTGLYLARAWESVQKQRRIRLLPSIAAHVKPNLLKTVVILLLAAPTTVLVLDGIIFKVFATLDSIHTRMDPTERVRALNLALAVRPGNPMPRILLIRSLLSAAETTESPEDRAKLLSQAAHETTILSKHAPALAIVRYFFPGKILALRNESGDLNLARDYLEHAVELVPSATGMRLELIKVYLKLGQEKEAYRAVQDARKWIRLEVDMPALAAFAKEARSVALSNDDSAEANYWGAIHAQLETFGFAG